MVEKAQGGEAMKLESAQEIMSEADLQGTVLDLLQVHGFMCHHSYQSKYAPRGRKGAARTNKGWPDIIAITRPPSNPHLRLRGPFRHLAIELKKEGEHATSDQHTWLWLLSLTGFEVYAWQPSDLNNGTIGRIIKG